MRCGSRAVSGKTPTSEAVGAGQTISSTGSGVTASGLPLTAVLVLGANAGDMGWLLAVESALVAHRRGPGTAPDCWHGKRCVTSSACVSAPVHVLIGLDELGLTPRLVGLSIGVGGVSNLAGTLLIECVTRRHRADSGWTGPRLCGVSLRYR